MVFQCDPWILLGGITHHKPSPQETVTLMESSWTKGQRTKDKPRTPFPGSDVGPLAGPRQIMITSSKNSEPKAIPEPKYQ